MTAEPKCRWGLELFNVSTALKGGKLNAEGAFEGRRITRGPVHTDGSPCLLDKCERRKGEQRVPGGERITASTQGWVASSNRRHKDRRAKPAEPTDRLKVRVEYADRRCGTCAGLVLEFDDYGDNPHKGSVKRWFHLDRLKDSTDLADPPGAVVGTPKCTRKRPEPSADAELPGLDDPGFGSLPHQLGLVGASILDADGGSFNGSERRGMAAVCREAAARIEALSKLAGDLEREVIALATSKAPAPAAQRVEEIRQTQSGPTTEPGTWARAGFDPLAAETLADYAQMVRDLLTAIDAMKDER